MTCEDNLCRVIKLIVSTGCIRWIPWFSRGYAAAAVCRGFLVTPLQPKVLAVEASNLQDRFDGTKACLLSFFGLVSKNKMAATAVSFKFLGTFRACNVHFPNLQDMFIMVKASLGIILDIWTKTRWPPWVFL